MKVLTHGYSGGKKVLPMQRVVQVNVEGRRGMHTSDRGVGAVFRLAERCRPVFSEKLYSPSRFTSSVAAGLSARHMIQSRALDTPVVRQS